LLPKLRRGDTGVLARRGMRIAVNGKAINPSRYDWSRVDIRGVPIVQAAGSSNPLGRVKFMFPNKHAVYMHDTPDKHLFKSERRLYSSGCIRVRNPDQLASLVFSQDRGWGKGRIASLMSTSAKANQRVDLEDEIDVHNVYFTAVVDEDGTLRTLRDVYGHDRRIGEALKGTAPEVIARSDPALALERSVKHILEGRGRSSSASVSATSRPKTRSTPKVTYQYKSKPKRKFGYRGFAGRAAYPSGY